MQETNIGGILVDDQNEFFENNFSTVDLSSSEDIPVNAGFSSALTDLSSFANTEAGHLMNYASKLKANMTTLTGKTGSSSFKTFSFGLAALAGKIASGTAVPATDLQKALYPGLKQYIVPDKKMKARISRDIVKAVLDEFFPDMNPNTKASISVIKAGLMSRESSWNTFILENSHVTWKGGVVPVMDNGALKKSTVGGFGLVQWTGARHKGFADTFTKTFSAQDLPWAVIDPRMQLMYFIAELVSFMPGCTKYGFKYNGSNLSSECIKIFTDPNFDVTFGELAGFLYFMQSGFGAGWKFPEKIIWGNPSMNWAYLGSAKNHIGGLTSKDLTLLESYGFQGWISSHKYLDAHISSDELESGALRFFTGVSDAQISSQKKSTTYITTPKGVKNISNSENWLKFYNL